MHARLMQTDGRTDGQTDEHRGNRATIRSMNALYAKTVTSTAYTLDVSAV